MSTTRSLRMPVKPKHRSWKIDEVNKKLTKARELLVSEQIDANDDRRIKSEHEAKINELGDELSKVEAKEKNSLDLFRRLSNTLLNVDFFYLDAEIEEKRGIVDAIYPQKLEIGKGAY